jgi:glutamate synthase (NADPH) small chain
MEESILKEAKRCLNCKNPLCRQGCPVNTPINEVIQGLLSGDILECGERLFDNNPLSAVCSLVCPHERHCEGNCVLSRKDNPIKIGEIENYISEYYLNITENRPIKRNGNKIAIIGSGPSGITIAITLALKGYDITIFEAHDNIGGVLRYGIPQFRLHKNILENLKKKMMDLGIRLRPNILIGQVLTIDDIFRDGYKAVFIGTGVWKPRTLGIKGESFGNVHFAIDYLKNPQSYSLGNRVCIIGGGNSAIDVARTVIRNGSREVYVMYHKGLEKMAARPLEVEYAKIDGVRFEFYKNPIEIVDEGVKYRRTDVEAESSEMAGTELFEADSIIVAIGQGPRSIIVSNNKGIDVNDLGLIRTDEYGKTSREGVFASGDVVTGADSVVGAVSLSKKVAQAIHEYVSALQF